MRERISRRRKHIKHQRISVLVVLFSMVLSFMPLSFASASQHSYPYSASRMREASDGPNYPFRPSTIRGSDTRSAENSGDNDDSSQASEVFLRTASPSREDVHFSSGRDCDDNAVLHCGAITTEELYEKYMESESAQEIFDYFGMNADTLSDMDGSVVAGKIYRDGRVTVGSETVATDAYTAGRQNMIGSERVESGGVTFYTRSPNVSFRSDGLDTFVIIDENGQYRHAVIASCGNPVRAKPVPVERPVQPVIKEEPKEVPRPVVPVPKPEPQPVPPPASEPIILPVTGAGSAVALASGTATILGTAAHYFYTKRRH